MVRRARVPAIGLVIGLWAAPGATLADKLADARAALDAVDYAEAQPLLVDALHAGGNSPARVVELYRLLASTATVLGERDAAEGYYRRWLELEPTANLPDSVAPKLREPFVAAQVYMAARAALAASAGLRAGAAEVAVAADPLAMVAAVEIDGARRPLGIDRRARAQLHAGTRHADVALIDEFGNHLAELAAVDDTPTTAVSALPPNALTLEPRDTSVSLWRQPWTWGASTVAFGLVGGGFAIAAHNANSQLDTIRAHSSEYYYSDAQSAQRSRDRDFVIATASFAVAGACAATAIVMLALHPHHRRVAPSASGVAIAW
jgi:hypothetical protein